MKRGELAMITTPVPSLFESIEGDAFKMTRQGDIVLLLDHEPNSCHWPSWRSWLVLYGDQIGMMSGRWLRSVKNSDPISRLNCSQEFDTMEGD